MPTLSQFKTNPLLQTFNDPKYPDSVIEEFLSMAISELEEHRQCMGSQFDRIACMLTAHRISKWSAGGLFSGSNVGELPLSEMRQIVSSLSVTDEGGSESVTFRQDQQNNSDKSSEDFGSTEFGRLYLSLYERYKCPRTWMVA